MKGFILAAGIGSRLKPWTDHHPKALAPVDGIPMLQRVVEKMYQSGISDITINVYHFADQIIDFIRSKGWNINISDERQQLLETGGAILHASRFMEGEQPVLVHNADILSNADFTQLEKAFKESRAAATLLVSPRESSRKLIFNPEMSLIGWHSLKNDSYKPEDFKPSKLDREFAFSGIYIISPKLPEKIKSQGFEGRFSIMDYFLDTLKENRYSGILKEDLRLIDIGKPDTLETANELLKTGRGFE